MRGRRRITGTVGVAVLALGLTAQAALAKPYEAPPRLVVVQAPRHVQPWSPATMHASGNPSARGHSWVTVAHDPAAVAAVPAPGSGGVDWTTVVGGAAIVVLVGALGAVLFRLRPQQPSTA
jgi:hypothetical protein